MVERRVVTIKLDLKKFQGSLVQHLEKIMQKVVLLLERRIKILISRSNPGGKFPSLPGEPPKVVTGILRSSIASRIEKSATKINGFVGVARSSPAHKYGKALELGSRRVKARPYLRPTLYGSYEEIKQIIKNT